jgi:hypothetical protein
MRTLHEIHQDMAALTTPSGDTESDHGNADDLLVETIRWVAERDGAVSWKPWLLEIAENFDRVKKWYA